ncbi:hypothetical protein PGB90_000307 [Kerria lacca]
MNTEDTQQFCLRWHNYQSSLLATLPQLLDGDDLTDVTLCAGSRSLKAHRVVLSACSEYFKELFKELGPSHHPVIVLPGVEFADLCALVTFMYSGEVNIYESQLASLLSMADVLHIRGLADFSNTTNVCSKPSKNKRPRLSEGHDLVSKLKNKPTLSDTEVFADWSMPPLSNRVDYGSYKLENLGNHGSEPFTNAEETTVPTDLTQNGSSENFKSSKGNVTKTFTVCFICGKQLSNHYNLRVHMETHQNMQYACSACNHVSRSRDALRKHVSYRHPPSATVSDGNTSQKKQHMQP